MISRNKEITRGRYDKAIEICNSKFSGSDTDQIMMLTEDLWEERRYLLNLTETKRKYISQLSGTCCFVIAAANCLIYRDLSVPDLEKAYDIACCRNGSAIYKQATVDYLKAPLSPTMDYDEVLQIGGILNIWHPIFNGHCVFIAPYDKDHIIAVNSWLGPNFIIIGPEEISRFLPEHNNLGNHWRMI